MPNNKKNSIRQINGSKQKSEAHKNHSKTNNSPHRSKSKSGNKAIAYSEAKKNYYLIPIFIILCIIPLLMRMKAYNPNMSQFLWFGAATEKNDFFLFYKQWAIVLMAGIMILIIAYKAYSDRRNIQVTPVFIPLFVYALLAFLSAIFSKYASFSYSGSFDQFENVFALMGYCVIAYYTFLFVKSENDLKEMTSFFLIAVLIMSVIGFFQFIGHDIISTEFGKSLVLPEEVRRYYNIDLVFGENRVFLTLFNPNYVGVYVALFLPIMCILLFFTKDVKRIILLSLALIGLAICIVGSGSVTGILCIGVAFVFALVFMWRYLCKRLYITIPVIALLAISLLVANFITDRTIETRIKNMFKDTTSTYPIAEMITYDDSVFVNYKGNELYVTYTLNDDQTASIVPHDKEGNTINCSYDADTNSLVLMDEAYAGITLGARENGIFTINADGLSWNFSNQTGDGTYYYYNHVGMFDKLNSAPSALFEGNELFATGRGYIWSRTIPLLKEYILLGSGPDTFTMVFPQNDYMNMIKYGFPNMTMTKPHNLYLQIGVQTGVLSLVAFLLFYGMYFISSIRLYIRGRFHSYASKVGFAIFIGTFAYMLTGITNDSSITTAPVFWAIIGTGIAANHMAAPLIQREIEEYKVTKSNMKNHMKNDRENNMNKDMKSDK